MEILQTKKAKMNVKNVNLVVVFFLVLTVAYLFFKSGGTLMPEKEIVNGYWDEATQECRSIPNHQVGIPHISTTETEPLYQCCFNQESQQIDCNNPENLFGGFAIYQGKKGIFSIVDGITIKNTRDFDITAWIDSATWMPENLELTNAYSEIVGRPNGIPLLQNQAVDFSTSRIDLQLIGGSPNNPITYNLELITKASSVGLPDASQTIFKKITVEKQAIGFSVVIK